MLVTQGTELMCDSIKATVFSWPSISTRASLPVTGVNSLPTWSLKALATSLSAVTLSRLCHSPKHSPVLHEKSYPTRIPSFLAKLKWYSKAREAMLLMSDSVFVSGSLKPVLMQADAKVSGFRSRLDLRMLRPLYSFWLSRIIPLKGTEE